MFMRKILFILAMCLSLFGSAYAQQTVTGTVTDEDGLGIPGVSVIEKGTNNGVVTSIDGEYSLSVPADAILSFSFVGMTTVEEAVNGRSVINVTLVSDAVGIDEVRIVAALGVKRQARSMGYMTQAVGGTDLVQSNTPNVASALSGKLAGVNITNANQIDGGTSRIVIRGNNNITGNNQPLFIVDGIPIENNVSVNTSGTQENTSSVSDYGTGINYLNPDDIEEMNVLKGPAAAALYGARGANGVILITTKKGSKKEGVGISYTFNTKITDPYRFREQQNVYGYGGLAMPMYTADNDLMYEKDSEGNTLYPRQKWNGDRYEGIYGQMPHGLWTFDATAFTWHGYSTSWGRKMDGKLIKWWDGEMRPHSPQPDNQEYYYRNGIQNSHNISFSNAGDFGSVRVGIGHVSNDAVVYNSNYNKTNVTIGSILDISDVLDAELSASYSDYSRLNGMDMTTSNDYFTKFIYNYPVDYRPELDHQNYKREDGTKNSHGNGTVNPYGINAYDVFWNIYEKNKTQQRNQMLGAVKLVYTPLDWLSFMARSGIDYNNQEIEERHKPTDITGLRGYYFHSMAKEVVTNFDFLATATKDNLFPDINASFSFGGTSWDRERYLMSGRSGNRFKDPWIYSFQNYDLSQQNGQINSNQVPKEQRLEKRINSLYGFIDLSYSNLLYLQVTGRNDWSSTLPSNNNSYFYPSSSLSFVFSELLEDKEWLTFGKLRVAYAEAANDADPYQISPTFTSGSFGGFPTHGIKDVLPPVDLAPQTSRSYEAGIDLRLFDSRLKIDATYYRTVSDNQIMSAPIPVSSGYSNVKFNSGEMENKGFELVASYDIIRERDLSWTLGVNGSNNKNTLLSLDGVNETIIIGQFFGGNGPVIQVDVGEEYGNIYGWDYVLNDKGNRIVEERKDNDGNVVGTLYKTTTDRVKMGNSTPDLIGGINNSLRWKNFNLYALVDFSWGADIWSGDYATSLSSGVSPATLLERNGGGLPYTYPDGTQANHGIIMEGDLENGTPNDHVVHYIWKYGRLGSWGAYNLSAPSILENNWIKMREITLSYTVPHDIVRKTKVLQNARISVTGRDLFYIYSSLPDKINPEATSLTAGNAQGLMFGALPGMRSVSFSLNVEF
ncbi:SusC/RagA family TonB-linked outer membrane protein [Puteibacter caeruleilacunae]|nr:SusC/RagA family TonB-linked outer membrane protein [Puteibacter caeruleilacunae]